MSLKIVLALIGTMMVVLSTAAPNYPYSGQGYGHGYNQVDYYAAPHYKFAYAVNDHYTGDRKSASESRDGDKVTGEYSTHLPDGSIQRVTYYANKDGYFPTVHRTPGHGHGSF